MKNRLRACLIGFVCGFIGGAVSIALHDCPPAPEANVFDVPIRAGKFPVHDCDDHCTSITMGLEDMDGPDWATYTPTPQPTPVARPAGWKCYCWTFRSNHEADCETRRLMKAGDIQGPTPTPTPDCDCAMVLTSNPPIWLEGCELHEALGNTHGDWPTSLSVNGRAVWNPEEYRKAVEEMEPAR